MYSDTASKRGHWVIGLAVLVLALVFSSFFIGKDPGRDLSDEGAAAIESAVERSALQCYVVEGVYPPSLSYLEENYGLQVNTRDYYVRYEAFASNLPPTVKVIAK